MSEQPVEPELRPPADDDEALRLLREGVIDLEGRLLDASNVTLVGAIRTPDLAAECVYKPVAGERPLWDFPDSTLAGREIAAFLVSEATGWQVVPPTVLRDGPVGPGIVPRGCSARERPVLGCPGCGPRGRRTSPCRRSCGVPSRPCGAWPCSTRS